MNYARTSSKCTHSPKRFVCSSPLPPPHTQNSCARFMLCSPCSFSLSLLCLGLTSLCACRMPRPCRQLSSARRRRSRSFACTRKPSSLRSKSVAVCSCRYACALNITDPQPLINARTRPSSLPFWDSSCNRSCCGVVFTCCACACML